MRFILAALAIGLAACSADIPAAAPPGEGYLLEVRASEAEQTFMVTAPDGRMVAARASEDGASALLDAAGVQALSTAPPIEPPTHEVMVLRVPGVDLRISGDPEGTGEQGGRVAINVGGQSVEVNAEDGGGGDDRAHVRITGASAETARNFIVRADALSPSVQAQMLAALGLEEIERE